jgi:DNA polymerase-1
LHFTLHQLGADTGRLSSEKPNIQNIPQDREDQDVKISFRDCFEAEPGNVILTADYSQCELRILAERSQDKGFLEIFRRGDDLHIITSQQVFGYSDKELEIYLKIKPKDYPDANLLDMFSAEEVTAYKTVADFREKTKTINFGIVYGLSAWSLAERFKIPQAEAEKILDDYFKTYSGIKRWLGRNAHETLVNRYAKTIIGRKKYFHLADPEDEERFRRSKAATRRMGNNHGIQGTNADITKEALTRLQDAYDEIEGAKLLFTVHDEIVSEVPASMAEYVAGLKAEIMKEAFHRFVKTVPVGKDDKVSVTIASHWTK